MATYYIPHRSSAVPRTSYQIADGVHTTDLEPEDDPDGLPETSIYIFPNPPSRVPSPTTSVTSAPTEFDFSSSPESRTTSRTRLHSQEYLWRRRHRSTSTADRAPFCSATQPVHIATPSEDQSCFNVEAWAVTSDPSPDIIGSEGSWVLEDDAGFDVFPISQSTASVPFAAFSQHHNTAHIQRQYPLQTRQRTRTHSRSSLASLSHSAVPETTPRPRIHLPFLSFFALILRIDIDDPAVRLLTCSETGDSESVLFPGHSSTRLLCPNVEVSNHTHSARDDRSAEAESTLDDESAADDQTLGVETHGLPKLLLATLSDQSAVAIRALRAGLAVRNTSGPDLGYTLPRASNLLGLWQTVGDFYARSGQAWKSLWDSHSFDTPPPTGI